MNEKKLTLLYENSTWLQPLLQELILKGVSVEAIPLQERAFDPDNPPEWDLVFNRLSPSAANRGHGHTLETGLALLESLEDRGVPTVNGSRGFRHELSKLAQHRLLRRHGLQTPKTLFLTRRPTNLQDLVDFGYPAILKPNTGGSGFGVRDIEGIAHLQEQLEGLSGEELLILQEKLEPVDGAVHRLEFIEGELVYALKAQATNTYNLCPAESCERPPADAGSPLRPQVDFHHLPNPDGLLVRRAALLLKAAGLEVGGVEYILTDRGPVLIDINATSVYRDDIAVQAGVDPWAQLATYLEQRLHRLAPAASGKI